LQVLVGHEREPTVSAIATARHRVNGAFTGGGARPISCAPKRT